MAPAEASDLMRGKLARFSRARLQRFLNALDTGGRTVADLVSENRE
jgi:predicted XRE-type DNA-binding protein